MSGHTPGPWAWGTFGAGILVVPDGSDGIDKHRPICNLDPYPGFPIDDETACNANLIAAAPQLLDLLREVSGFLHGISVGAYSRNNMEQLAHELSSQGFVLIAKATNQQGNNHD